MEAEEYQHLVAAVKKENLAKYGLSRPQRKAVSRQAKKFAVINGQLNKRVRDGKFTAFRIVVQLSEKERVLQEVHDNVLTGGHTINCCECAPLDQSGCETYLFCWSASQDIWAATKRTPSCRSDTGGRECMRMHSIM
jgi:hypothetical protein